MYLLSEEMNQNLRPTNSNFKIWFPLSSFTSLSVHLLVCGCVSFFNLHSFHSSHAKINFQFEHKEFLIFNASCCMRVGWCRQDINFTFWLMKDKRVLQSQFKSPISSKLSDVVKWLIWSLALYLHSLVHQAWLPYP